jgi:serine/threonine protein phosphatase PrpC
VDITSFALTHPGLRREANEDSLSTRPDLGFWAVCDGMGGHAAGEVASRLAVETIEAFVETTAGVTDTNFTWPFGFDRSIGVDGTRLVTAFRLANRAIDVRVADDPASHGMATTAVALLLAKHARRSPGSSPRLCSGEAGPEAGVLHALVAHVGDSRAYLWREGVLTRQTQDHSWVEEQRALGTLTEADARTHPWRNLVTRAISGGPDPRVDVTPLALEPGDRVLLCSDGLTAPVADDVIASVLAKGARGDLESICQTLVDAANAAGGPDNITVVLVEML